jgi:hypothetical protein
MVELWNVVNRQEHLFFFLLFISNFVVAAKRSGVRIIVLQVLTLQFPISYVYQQITQEIQNMLALN